MLKMSDSRPKRVQCVVRGAWCVRWMQRRLLQEWPVAGTSNGSAKKLLLIASIGGALRRGEDKKDMRGNPCDSDMYTERTGE